MADFEVQTEDEVKLIENIVKKNKMMTIVFAKRIGKIPNNLLSRCFEISDSDFLDVLLDIFVDKDEESLFSAWLDSISRENFTLSEKIEHRIPLKFKTYPVKKDYKGMIVNNNGVFSFYDSYNDNHIKIEYKGDFCMTVDIEYIYDVKDMFETLSNPCFVWWYCSIGDIQEQIENWCHRPTGEICQDIKNGIKSLDEKGFFNAAD